MRAKTPRIAPLDVRLGIVTGRMTPAMSEVTGRLAANLPQRATWEMLAERFSVTPSVETYCRVVADLARVPPIPHVILRKWKPQRS